MPVGAGGMGPDDFPHAAPPAPSPDVSNTESDSDCVCASEDEVVTPVRPARRNNDDDDMKLMKKLSPASLKLFFAMRIAMAEAVCIVCSRWM